MGSEASSGIDNPIDFASEPRKVDTDSTPDSMLIQEKDDPKIISAEKPLGSVEPCQSPSPGESRERHLRCLEERVSKLRVMLETKEKLKLQIFETRVDEAYYLLWSCEANRIFKLLVVLTRRIIRLKKMR